MLDWVINVKIILLSSDMIVSVYIFSSTHRDTETHIHSVCHNSVQLVIFSSPETQNSREIVQSGLMWRTSVCTHSSLSFWEETIKRGLKKKCQREESQHICLFFFNILLADTQVQV